MRPRVVIVIGLAAMVLAGAWWLLRPTVPTIIDRVRQSVTPEPAFQFAVVGDNHGVNPVYRQIIQDITGKNYAFLLNLADTSDEGRTAEWQAVKELESALPYPVYHTVGSHDIKTDDTRQSFIAVFGQARWYAVDYRQLHLVILDNADRKVGWPADELTWLEKDLSANRNKVIALAYHRPFGLPLAAILGDDETTVSTKTNDQLTTLLARYNIRQIFTSHLHTYLPYTLAGIPAVVSGGGGDPAQLVLGGAKNNYFHYLEVTVRGNDIQVTPIRITINTTE